MRTTDQAAIEVVLEQWAAATRTGQQDKVLANHLDDVLIYDVLAPMKYESAAAYRKSWGDWQSDTQGEGQFGLEDLAITAGPDVAFANGFIRCGGELPDGLTFEDLVRATFCLCKTDGSWKIAHQHISKPIQFGG